MTCLAFIFRGGEVEIRPVRPCHCTPPTTIVVPQSCCPWWKILAWN